MKATEYTICITNYSRPDHLRRCLESVKSLPNVVVASYGAGPEHRGIIESVRPGTRCFVTPNDYGENHLLLQAVALADTKWVVILHDDDQLVPDFATELSRIDPLHAGFIAWDGQTEWYDGREPKRVNPWGSKTSGLQSSQRLLRDVTVPHGGMVRSPVTMMLRKDTAMAVLSWCEEGLAEFHTRPTMMIGNEIALLFGHLKEFPTFYHIQKPLVKFGHWEGSETIKYVNGEVPELVKLYDGVRKKFGGEQFVFRRDKILPIFVHAYTGGKPGPRQALAQSTWPQEHATLEKEYLIVPLKVDESKLPRTSEKIGDTRKMPFLHDMMNAASSFCYGDHDIIHVTNDDLCVTEGGLRPMVERTKKRGSTYAHRREFIPQDLQKLGLTGLTRPLTPEEIITGREHSGCDSVTFTNKWWKDIGSVHLPDFVIGCEAWDTIIIMLMRMSGSGWGWKNTTYHEYHSSFWKTGDNHFSNPGQIHNRRLAKEYLVAHSIYRGEFEPGSKKDPAYPKHPPGCDTHPDTPVVKYMGDPTGFVEKPVKTRTARPAPAPASTDLPTPITVLDTPEYERAIVIPWKHNGEKWHELRYALRSIEKHFADTKCPIAIFGTQRPHWLLFSKHRIQFHDCWSYKEAVTRGVQFAEKVAWWNDDIMLLKDTDWDDLKTPLHLGPVTPKIMDDMIANPNPWRNGVLRVIRELDNRGFSKPLIYSTHTPYLYDREVALDVLREFGVWEKIPLEMAYFNTQGIEGTRITDERVQGAPFGDARFLNIADHLLTQEVKDAVMERFPNFAEWELKVKF